MDNIRRLEYCCEYHGVFEKDVEWGSEEVWQSMCPVCFAQAPRTKYVPGKGLPNIRTDGVIMPYFSPNLGEWVSSRKDFREKQRAKGLVTLSDRDLKDACDQVHSIAADKKRERKRIAQDKKQYNTFCGVAQEAEPQGGTVYG